MPKEAPCLKVPKIKAENTLVLANKLGINDKTLEIPKENTDSICIPLTRKLKESELELFIDQVPELQLDKRVFQEKNQPPKSLVQHLEDQLAPNLLASLPRALDIVGDIAIIEIPPELETHKNVVGEAVLKTHRNVRTVLAKAGAVSGTYRLREYDFVAGQHKTETVYKEYGCSYHVDVARAYFSPRLSHEHDRVAALVQKNETVVDLFAGVGPFAVLIAKNHADAKVYAVDINADAIELLKKNIRLNRVENRVHPIVGDAGQIVDEKLLGIADRVIMNLPEKASEFVDVACKAIKPTGGFIHFYGFVRLPDTTENFKTRFIQAAEKAGKTVETFLYADTVRATAPYEWQVVLDAKIR